MRTTKTTAWMIGAATLVASQVARADGPYSLPWQMRPIVATTSLRDDNSLAFSKLPNGDANTTIVSILSASYKIDPHFAPFVKIGYVHNAEPASGGVLTNPAAGGTYAIKLSDDLRLALFLGVTAPLAGGGGNHPSVASASAIKSGVYARAAFDNALFAPNDLAVFPGVDLAWIRDSFTFQFEATFFQLERLRGADAQKDSSKTNSTFGFHAGYYVLPPVLLISAELRYQRWLSTPSFLAADKSQRDQFSFSAGLRYNYKFQQKVWMRPGVAFSMGIDDPMASAKYKIVQIDIPVVWY